MIKLGVILLLICLCYSCYNNEQSLITERNNILEKNEPLVFGDSIIEVNTIVDMKLDDCGELFERAFFEKNGIAKNTNGSNWKGSFENDLIEIEYWSQGCAHKGCKIKSKTSCARSFYSYQNGILVTFDSVNPQCESEFFYQKGMPDYSLPIHVREKI